MSSHTTDLSTRPPTGTDALGSPPVVPIDHSQLLRRGVAIVGLLGIALVHVIDATAKFHETQYLGWLYVGLIVGSVGAAAALVERDHRSAWVAAAGLSGLAFAGYALSRTTGLPAAHDDVGNWFEPLGLATLFLEASVLLVSIRELTAGRSGSFDTGTRYDVARSSVPRASR